MKLPQNWSKFIGHPANKTELASFLSNEICLKADYVPVSCELVLGGGSSEATSVWSSCREHVVSIECTHEEANTRLLLHAYGAEMSGYDRVVLMARGTDILILALSHHSKLLRELWMPASTAKDPKSIPFHTISQPNPLINENLLAYHAVTGCDAISQFTGKAKRTTWRTFLE